MTKGPLVQHPLGILSERFLNISSTELIMMQPQKYEHFFNHLLEIPRMY